MEKNRVKDLLKIVGVTALTLTLAASAFLGINSLAFAAAAKTELLSPVTAPVGPDTKAADNALLSDYKKPNITVIWDEGLDENGKPYPTNIPSSDSLSPEEAAQIGAQYIWDMTGESIDGLTVKMIYSSWPSYSRSYWTGDVIDPAEVPKTPDRIQEHYEFVIDAVTGDRVSLYPYILYPYFDIPFTPAMLGEGKTVTMTPLQLETMQYEAPPEVEEFAEIAREYAQKHFNHSKVTSVDFCSITVRAEDGQYIEAYKAGKDIPYSFTIYEKLRIITFSVTDDTGRVAILDIDMDTNLVKSIDAMDSDFIPGYQYESVASVR